MTRALVILTCTALTACGSAEAKPKTPHASSLRPTPDPTKRSQDPLELPLGASFGELIGTINRLSELDSEPTASCLVGRASSFVIRSPIARAMRPLPPPPKDLDAMFATVTDPVRLLTLWGQLGVEADRLVAVTFTPTSADATRPVFTALTDRGVIVRSENLKGAGTTREIAIEALREEQDLALVIVSAEKNVPLRDVTVWLEDLHSLSGVSVALAVVLPEGTRIPEPSPDVAHDLRCNGPEGHSTGDLSVASVRTSILSIKPVLADCLAQNGGARGGSLQVRLGVSNKGQVDRGCITNGSLGSAVSERCVIDTLLRLELEPPSPAGTRATIMLPLVLRPQPQPPVRPLCY